MIIGVLNQKGGVGKSTLSTSIAHYLARSGHSVLLVDADPQQTSLNWSEARGLQNIGSPFPIFGHPKESLKDDLPGIAKKYDYVIVDGPPRAERLARACIMSSDFVLIPCTPSAYDVWASVDTIRLVNDSKMYKSHLAGALVVSRRISNTAIGRDVVDSLKELEFPILDSIITQRVIFAEAASSGRTVFDMEPQGKAAGEIINLVSEILNHKQEGRERDVKRENQSKKEENNV